MERRRAIRALVIDDSAFSRQTITRMLDRSPLVEVIGVARDGEGAKGKNESVGFSSDGSEVVRYQKNRTFRYTSESEHFENGTELPLFEWLDWKIAPLICYDLRAGD